jgi:hypothetical protein
MLPDQAPFQILLMPHACKRFTGSTILIVEDRRFIPLLGDLIGWPAGHLVLDVGVQTLAEFEDNVCPF